MDNNNQNLEGIAKSSLLPQNSHIPQGFRYTSNTILAAIVLTYLGGASYLLAENLENSKASQATLPIAMAGIVGGAFVIINGYSRAVNGTAKVLYSNSTRVD